MVVVVVVVIVVGVEGVKMTTVTYGGVVLVPYCTQKALMGEGHSTVMPKDEGGRTAASAPQYSQKTERKRKKKVTLPFSFS